MLRVLCFVHLGFMASAGCAITIAPDPVVEEVHSLTWSVGALADFEALIASAQATSSAFDAKVETKDPVTVNITSPELSASNLDDHCRYPIINSKTGGRMHTFATWQFEKLRSTIHEGRRITGHVLIQIHQEPSGVVTVSSNCRADTMLGRQAAASLGTWEKPFFEAMRAHLR